MFDEIVEHWSDAYGLVSPYYQEDPTKKQDCSGNGVFYTGCAVWLLDQFEDLNEYQAQAFRKSLQMCAVSQRNRMVWGVLNRSAVNYKDGVGPDDYIGAICASFAIPDSFRGHCYTYGRDNYAPIRGLLDERFPRLAPLFNAIFGRIKVRWNYNNLVPGTVNNSSWMGRFPHLIAMLHYANYRTPPLWMRYYFFLSRCFSGSRKSTDGWIQTGMMLWVADYSTGFKSILVRLAKRIFQHRLNKTWGGWVQVWEEQFHERHPLRGGTHPIVTYARLKGNDRLQSAFMGTPT